MQIPSLRVEVLDSRGEVGWIAETHVVQGLDLDGAGSPVVLVPPDRRHISITAMHWRLFIQRGTCGHEVGIVMGMGDPVLESGESHGLKNFSIAEPLPADVGADGIASVGITVYSFDGRRYVGGRTEVR